MVGRLISEEKKEEEVKSDKKEPIKFNFLGNVKEKDLRWKPMVSTSVTDSAKIKEFKSTDFSSNPKTKMVYKPLEDSKESTSEKHQFLILKRQKSVRSERS